MQSAGSFVKAALYIVIWSIFETSIENRISNHSDAAELYNGCSGACQMILEHASLICLLIGLFQKYEFELVLVFSLCLFSFVPSMFEAISYQSRVLNLPLIT